MHKLTAPDPAAAADALVQGLREGDPYRWLEGGGARVEEWIAGQNASADSQIAAWPAFAQLRALVEHFTPPLDCSVPVGTGDQWFRVESAAAGQRVVVAQEPLGEGRDLYVTPDSQTTVQWISPSPGGRVLAFGVCDDGSERNEMILIDVETGTVRPRPPAQRLRDLLGKAQWLPDGSAFYYTAPVSEAPGAPLRVFLHHLDGALEPEVEAAAVGLLGWPSIQVDPSSGQAFLSIGPLSTRPWFIRGSAPGDTWTPFLGHVDATVVGSPWRGEFISITDLGAARRRLVAIPADPDVARDPTNWRELLAESDAVLTGVYPAGDFLFVTELADTFGRARLLTASGQLIEVVPVPPHGSFEHRGISVGGSAHAPEIIFAYSTLTTSRGIYRYVPGQPHLEPLQRPRACLPDAEVITAAARSADGAMIPYHVVRNAQLEDDPPTLLYGYGGFELPFAPAFPEAMASFVASGGAFVHCHLRGGGELGRDWWQAGRMGRKHNSFLDLYAIAEKLIRDKMSTPARLAVTGASNGGLLAGMAFVDRPELWTAVVPQVPLLDLIGALDDPYGRFGVAAEYADVNDPEEIRRLVTFSPYHRIRQGVHYPALYIHAGAEDPRCPPWHGRKFVARLRDATGPGHTTLLREWENAGHGLATGNAQRLLHDAYWLAFVMQQLNMSPAAVLPDEPC